MWLPRRLDSGDISVVDENDEIALQSPFASVHGQCCFTQWDTSLWSLFERGTLAAIVSTSHDVVLARFLVSYAEHWSFSENYRMNSHGDKRRGLKALFTAINDGANTMSSRSIRVFWLAMHFSSPETRTLVLWLYLEHKSQWQNTLWIVMTGFLVSNEKEY